MFKFYCKISNCPLEVGKELCSIFENKYEASYGFNTSTKVFEFYGCSENKSTSLEVKSLIDPFMTPEMKMEYIEEINPSLQPRLYNAIKTAEERKIEIDQFNQKFNSNNVGQLVDQIQKLEVKIAELTKIIEDSGIQYEDPDAEETRTLFQRIKGWFGW
jgi:hypothetical protein